MNKLALVVAATVAVGLAACSKKEEAAQAPAAASAQSAPAAAPSAMPSAQGVAPADALHQQAMAQAHPGGMPMSAPMASAPAAAAAGANAGQGKVLQTMHASSYTYMEIDTGAKKVWLAANAMQVNNGDTVRWPDGAVMKNFTSNTLHRTFEEILFVSQAQVVK